MPNKMNVPDLISDEQRAALDQQNVLAADLYAPGQTIEQMRDGYNKERAWWNEGGPTPVESRDFTVPTRHGDVRVRLHRGSTSADLPAIVYVHGGGFSLGSVDTHDRITRILSVESGAAVFSIDYTLAPEGKYPQPVEEVADVITFIRENSKNLNIDPFDISFAGDSGGASLSYGTYVYLRDQKASAGIRCLLLIYGWFGLRDSTSIRRLGGEWDGLSAEDFDMYKALYFRNADDAFAPYVDIFSNDLMHNVPPAYIAGAQYDPIVDDSRTLASIYADSGIPYELEVVPGTIHGFIHHGRIVTAANEVLAHAAAFFKAHEDSRTE